VVVAVVAFPASFFRSDVAASIFDAFFVISVRIASMACLRVFSNNSLAISSGLCLRIMLYQTRAVSKYLRTLSFIQISQPTYRHGQNRIAPILCILKLGKNAEIVTLSSLMRFVAMWLSGNNNKNYIIAERINN